MFARIFFKDSPFVDDFELHMNYFLVLIILPITTFELIQTVNE